MQNKKNEQEKHLTAQEVAICAEAIAKKREHKLPAPLRIHLVNCMQCLLEAQIIAEITDSEPVVYQKADNRINYKHLVFPLLAASLILGVVVLLFNITQQYDDSTHKAIVVFQDSIETVKSDQEEEQTNPGIESQESVIIDDDAILIAREQQHEEEPAVETETPLLAAFIPDQDLEMLVRNYQTAYRGEQVSVITPSFISFAQHTSLVWENPQQIKLLVEIVDNEANEIFSTTTSSDSVVIPELQPGLYYWKLIQDDYFDLLFTGKIIHEP